MISFNKSFRAVLAAGLIAGTLLGPVAARAADSVPPGTPAFVDLSRVLREFQKTSAYAKYQIQLRDQAKVFDDEIQFLAQLRYCTEEERAEGLALRAKPKLTPKEKSRLEELTKKADRIDNEISMLSQKQNPTEAESARILELSKMRTEAVKTLSKEQMERREQLRKMEASLMADVEADLLKIVEKVAKDQKITTVYERRAVLLGGNDLTDLVVKKLPK
jgi:Skp family chaperone for outer membrane proteins